MFYVRVGNESVLYTGDYNMTPDRHLGAARLPFNGLKPDLLITETTYATTIRDSKRARERNFLQRVHETVEKGGKVLIPVFALGRAQELCILLETYWERMNLGNIPIYFAPGMIEKANLYYKLFIHWTNEKIKMTFVQRNMFDFKHIKTFEKSFLDHSGPMVLLATPGMLHAGLSLEAFKRWCSSANNTCILPGYCVVGTVGNKLLAGHRGHLAIDSKTTLDVQCLVANLSFSAHADAKGIMQLIRSAQPSNVMLVHGEKGKMAFLKLKIMDKFKGVKCYDPANGELVEIQTPLHIYNVQVSSNFVASAMEQENFDWIGKKKQKIIYDVSLDLELKKFTQDKLVPTVIVADPDHASVKVMTPQEATQQFGIFQHKLKSELKFSIHFSSLEKWIQIQNHLIPHPYLRILYDYFSKYVFYIITHFFVKKRFMQMAGLVERWSFCYDKNINDWVIGRYFEVLFIGWLVRRSKKKIFFC